MTIPMATKRRPSICGMKRPALVSRTSRPESQFNGATRRAFRAGSVIAAGGDAVKPINDSSPGSSGVRIVNVILVETYYRLAGGCHMTKETLHHHSAAKYWSAPKKA